LAAEGKKPSVFCLNTGCFAQTLAAEENGPVCKQVSYILHLHWLLRGKSPVYFA